MAYRNKTYVCFDGDTDIHYYRMMKAWHQSDNSIFNFYDAHDINSARDSSLEGSIKAQLRIRLANTRIFVVLVGERTRYLTKFVKWEMEQALDLGLPIIAVNLNGLRQQDADRCPPTIRHALAPLLCHSTFACPLAFPQAGCSERFHVPVAQVTSRGRTAYLLAMAQMNAHGVAHTTIENVRNSMVALWEFISERGGGLPRLRVPILGTGFGRLVTTRQEMVKEILRSVVATSNSNRFCESFTIVISMKDYLEHQMDLAELGDYLRYQTFYTEISAADDVGRGVAVPG